jgi:hypothetical protein
MLFHRTRQRCSPREVMDIWKDDEFSDDGTNPIELNCDDDDGSLKAPKSDSIKAWLHWFALPSNITSLHPLCLTSSQHVFAMKEVTGTSDSRVF